MSKSDGKLVQQAINAVRQCHDDVSRLLVDFEDYMTKSQEWTDLWDNSSITYGMSKAIYKSNWMPKQLYRYFKSLKVKGNEVEGLNIRFYTDEGKLEQPMIYFGRVRYANPKDKELSKVADIWDFDSGFRDWCPADSERGCAIECSSEERQVEKMVVCGMNLYSVENLADITLRLESIREGF